MIHVVTVHFGSDRWIDIQLDYLKRNLHEPYRVVANLEGVDAVHHAKFDRVVDAKGEHAGKLNLLAAEIAAEAAPDDLLMFLDGDAFPIADPMPVVRHALTKSVLVAVRRAENGGDKQPHPCFCVVPVREWERLHGDWSPGHCFQLIWGGYRTDVGGNLLAALERTGSVWTPLLRTNRVNPHLLWFAVYADIVYHHGAGFREPKARGNYFLQPKRWKAERLPVVGVVLRKIDSGRIRVWKRLNRRRSRRLSKQIYEQIRDDPEFYRQFLAAPEQPSDHRTVSSLTPP